MPGKKCLSLVGAMAVHDIPLFNMLKTRMRWHQDRQKVLAENVANAETPGYRARDLRAPNFAELMAGRPQPGGPVAPLSTGSVASMGASGARHIPITPGGQTSRFDVRRDVGVQRTPDGNAVNLEDEMMKVAQNQMDFQAVSGLYQRSLGLIRTAIGRRGG